MADSRPVKKIGIFGHVGNQNLGDEAIIAAVIQNTKLRVPDAEVYGFAINPEDAQRRHGIKAFPIRRTDRGPQQAKQGAAIEIRTQQPEKQTLLAGRIKPRLKSIPVLYAFLRGIHRGWGLISGCLAESKFLAQCYGNLKGIDLLIITGSQQLSDYFGGAWGFPYTLFKWTLLARLRGTKVAFLGVGAGPINSRLGRFFAKSSLSLASYRSYRDEGSGKFIEAMGVRAEGSVCPDLVYSLEIVKPLRPAKSATTVGINPLPFFDRRYWPAHDTATYQNYVKKLASLALWLIDRGYTVLFFPTQLRADPPVIADIEASMKTNERVSFGQRLLGRPVASFEELLSEIASTDFVVATRFHGVLFSYLLNKPVLGISYHRKTDDLMARMGQSEYVLNIKSFDCETLIERFLSLESKSDAIRAEIEQRLCVCRRALEEQYDRVFGLLHDERRAQLVRG